MARGYARGREKDEAARAALKPLAPGERPTAVTVAGVVALVLGAGNVVVYLRATRSAASGRRSSACCSTRADVRRRLGLLQVRYWAVLGMQALLGLTIISSRSRDGAESVLVVLVAWSDRLAGTLFWFLVKSMARIQMPERPGS